MTQACTNAIVLQLCALAGCSISYPNHARLVKQALAALSILVEKVTHLSRVFATQLMISMGLSPEEAQRAGGWLKDSFGTAYIIFSLSPASLLALAMWRVEGHDMQCFGHPRFHISVPDELLFHALPALKGFREQADAMAQAATAPGAAAELKKPALLASQLARVLTVATVARIQDAIAEGERYPRNPFNADVMKHPLYRWVLSRSIPPATARAEAATAAPVVACAACAACGCDVAVQSTAFC